MVKIPVTGLLQVRPIPPQIIVQSIQWFQIKNLFNFNTFIGSGRGKTTIRGLLFCKYTNQLSVKKLHKPNDDISRLTYWLYTLPAVELRPSQHQRDFFGYSAILINFCATFPSKKQNFTPDSYWRESSIAKATSTQINYQ